MREEEIKSNELLDIFKNTASNKRTLTEIECAEHINVSKEKELNNKPNTDFLYFKVLANALIYRVMLNESLAKMSLKHRQIEKAINFKK